MPKPIPVRRQSGPEGRIGTSGESGGPAERADPMPETELSKDALRAILRATQDATGLVFFQSLVHHVAKQMKMRVVVVGEIAGASASSIRTVALWLDGKPAKNIEYELAGTPCGNVVGHRPCCHPKGVARLYPQDAFLRTHAIECYVGIPLFDSSDRPLGLFSVMDDRPLRRMDEVLSILEVFGPRAGAELQRLRIEAAYRESQRALTTLMSNLPGMAYRCRNEPDWRMEFVSEGCRELTGYPPSDLQDNHRIAYAELIVPEDRDKVWNDVQTALKKRGPFQLVYRIRTASGTLKWVWEQGRGVFADDSGVLALEGFITDITERKLAEEALRDSEERFRTTFAHANSGVALIDRNLRFIQVNRRLCDMLGYTQDEILSRSVVDLTHPQDLDATNDLIGRMLEGAASAAQLEKRYLRKDGRVVWGHVSVSVVRTSEGNPLHLIAQIQDITERKQAEARATSERRFSQSLIETAPTFIVGIDPAGNTIFMNTAMTKATGYEVSEVIGKNYGAMFLTEDERQGVESVFQRVLTGTEATHNENLVLTRDGRKLLVAWYGNAIFDPDGKVTALYGIGEDITERRRLEEQLRQAQKMESIGTLAGGIAHDFNNLLTVILGNVSHTLGKLQKDSPVRHSLQDVEKAAERAGALIQQILAFSRKSVLNIRPTNLWQCVEDTVALLRRGIDPRIQFRVRSQPGLWVVRADPNQMNQVIMNLCLNARDAMPDGGMLIIEARNRTLSQHHTGPGKEARVGEFVELIVSDTGMGMDEETQLRMFEPFFTTKEGGEGTGLGLSVVYGIVSQHEGWAEVRSAPNRGTAFHIFLPRDQSVATRDAPDGRQELPRGTETVLIVDDEELVLEMAGRVLSDCGYRVLTASDGAEAIKVYQKHQDHIAIVILDFTLPRMHGLKVLQSVRAINPDVRVIFCTGHGVRVQQLIPNASLAGIPLVSKPLTAERLAWEVRKALDA